MTLVAALLVVASLVALIARSLRVPLQSADTSAEPMAFVLAVVDEGSGEAEANLAGIPDVTVVAVRPGDDWLRATRHAATSSDPLVDREPSRVALGVVRSTDRVSRDLLVAVGQCFGDEKVGTIQVGLRVPRGGRGLLRRLQEMELLAYTELVLAARSALGAPGYGPAGHFVRLSAVPDGAALRTAAGDIEVDMLVAAEGWKSAFCHGAGVTVEPARPITRMVVKRAHALAGLFRVAARVPAARRAGGPGLRTVAQAVGLAFAALTLPVAVGLFAIRAGSGRFEGPDALGWVAWYLLLFGPGWVVGYVAWLRRGRGTLIGSVLIGHVFSVFTLYWLPAAWLGLIGLARGWGRTGIEPTLEATPVDVPHEESS